MKSTRELLDEFNGTVYADERGLIAHELLSRAPSDSSAVEALVFVLNDMSDSAVRRAIVEYLVSTRPMEALRGLAKSMFDPDPLVRARAAVGVAGYDDKFVLAPYITALLDAVSDPATREPAERAIRVVTGRGPEKITLSERERLRLGDTAQSIWPNHFVVPPASPTSNEVENTPPPDAAS